MCFVLYAGSQTPIPTVPWDENDRRLNTSEVSEHEAAVAEHFATPHLKYIGSSRQCGCGFRHAMYQNGEWPEIDFYDPEQDDADDEQGNHEQLVEFLRTLLRKSKLVELYGCWDGNWAESEAGYAAISVAQIADPHFVFRERFRYVVSPDDRIEKS